MDLKGTDCLVVGGARKLGGEIARNLAAHGANVAITYRTMSPDVAATCAAIEACGSRAAAVSGDVTSVAEAQRLVSKAAEALGGLQAMVYTVSGPFSPQRPETIDESQWNASLDAIAKGFFFTAQAAFAEFTRRQPVATGAAAAEAREVAASAVEAGVIVAITDVGGEQPWGAFSAHCAAKAAEIMLVRSLAKAWAENGVRVCGIAPGPLDLAGDARREATARAAQRSALKRLITPAEIAHAVRFCIENAGVTGANLAVDGGQLLF